MYDINNNGKILATYRKPVSAYEEGAASRVRLYEKSNHRTFVPFAGVPSAAGKRHS